MNRLKEASYNGKWENYSYDLAGNRIKKETAEGTEFYTYNTKNQLTQLRTESGLTRFHYDTQGNLLEETGAGQKQYSYDALNRLSSVRMDNLIQKNRYDGENLRHETEENGNIIRFIFDRGELSTEETSDSHIRYIYGNNKVLFSERTGADTDYHIQDEAGSTLFILDREHNIQKTYRYDAFGKVLEESGDIQNRLTYTGQMYDGATGQYYLRARFYNPAIGRFLQEDDYRGDGLNLYAYCGNNPVMYYDPSGYNALVYNSKDSPGNKGGSDVDIPNTKPSINQGKDPFRNANFKKPDIKMVNDAANQVGIDRKEFGNYIHEIKADLGMKANQNFTYQELLELAEEYKKMTE